MEDELQKRNTDCVYFLASPLTCKKGMDCEYRHSEGARLNPRDCWYWLSGSCLNPACAFRHPPLDGHIEASSEPVTLSHHSSIPVNKTNTPCYFYYNGFCNKGERCSFLHGPDSSAPAWKSLKTASEVNDTRPPENNTIAGTETGPTLIGRQPNSVETATVTAIETQFQPKEDLQKSVFKNAFEQSSSPQISMSEYEEAAAVRSDSLLPAEGFNQSRSLLCTDQSSEEQVDGPIEPEERWESSPGFDVLVDNISENLVYEDEPEYLLALDGEGRELNSQFLGYDFEDPVEYDLMYPEAEILYDHRVYDSFDCLDNEHSSDHVRNIPGCSRERILDPILPRKRKNFPVELAVNGRSGLDLRDRLRKRRVIDGHSVTRFSRRHDSSCLIGRTRERRRRHGMDQQLQGRSASEVRKNIIGMLSENETLSNRGNKQGWVRRSRLPKSRQHYKEKGHSQRQHISSKDSRKPVSRERISTREYTTFTGPKSLAQIKEEKRKAEGNGEGFGKMGYSSNTPSADFQGPKPLSEILKDKRKLGSAMDGDIISS